MNERDKQKYCLLWQEAKEIAKERGLEMSVMCPMELTCSGEHCVFIDPKTKVEKLIYKAPEEPIIGCW
jgi:hypothetical protein